MDLFVVDTVGGEDQQKKSNVVYSLGNDGVDETQCGSTASKNKKVKGKKKKDKKEWNYYGLPPPSVDIFEIFKNPKLSDEPLYVSDTEEKKQESDFDIFCRAMGWISIEGVLRKKLPKKDRRPNEVRLDELPSDIVHESLLATDVAAELKTSVLKGIEQKHDLKQPSEREAYRARKAEASKTKGKNWFNIPATEITDDLRQDMEVIQMRSVLNPKHFYKKNDMKVLPKYFQVGTVLPSPLDRHHERGERVSKKRSLVDELLEDAEFQQFNKRKYNEVMAEKSKNGFKKAYKKMKKLKKKS